MTQTHTPGPWHIVTDGISHWIEIEPNKITLIKAKKADRDLIAAAPELLAALKVLLHRYKLENCIIEGTIPFSDPLPDCEAAINKAEGK